MNASVYPISSGLESYGSPPVRYVRALMLDEPIIK